MAVNTDRTITWFGDRHNRQQMILGIPAQSAADKPGIICMQDVDDSGVVGEHYMWFDSSNNLRVHTSKPTNQDSDGTTVSGTGLTLDGAFDNGKIIDGATGSGTSAFKVGGTATDDKIEMYHDGAKAVINAVADDLLLSAAGGDVYTTGDLAVLADNKKVELGADGSTDSYLQFNATDLEVVSAAAIRFITSGDADDYMTISTASNVPTIGTTGTCNLKITSSSGTVDFADDHITTTGNVSGAVITGSAASSLATGSAIGNVTIANGSITDSSGAISFGNENLTTTGTLNVGADNVNLTIGASGATDSKIYFDGAGNLMLYDSNLGVARSLTEMYSGTTLNPTVTGNLTIQDGDFDWTNAATNETAVWTLAATTVDAIQLVAGTTNADVIQITAAALTTGNILSVTADAMANGKFLYLDADGGPGATGYYVYCYDGSAEDFAVGVNGNITGTGTLTLAIGDVDAGGKISRNNATGTNPILEIEETNAAGGVALLVDSDHTGAANAMEITYAGTDYGLSIVGANTAGSGLYLAGPASQTAALALVDGAAGNWVGADNIGMLHLENDGVLVAGSSMLRVSSTGANTAASFAVEIHTTGNYTNSTEGAALRIDHDGTAAAGTVYAVCIDAANDEALHVDTGLSLFDERVTITLADNTGPALAITNPDTTGNTNAVTIAPSGSGAGLAISPQEVDTQAILITTVASSTVPLLDLDLTTGAGWIGAATTGAIDVTADGAIVADGTLLRLASSGQPAAANDGVCLEIVETGAAQATSYAMRITSTNNEALHVDAGAVLVDETVTATLGVITETSDADVNNTTPTAAELTGAFGATSPDGWIGIVDDAGGDANGFIVWSNGTSYYFVKGTKAT